jgi:hypothetical protein
MKTPLRRGLLLLFRKPMIMRNLMPGLSLHRTCTVSHSLSGKNIQNCETYCFCRKPGIILEPIEKSLDVTIRQECKPCFIIDIGPEEVCTINNLKMMLTGPNKELDMKAYQESV